MRKKWTQVYYSAGRLLETFHRHNSVKIQPKTFEACSALLNKLLEHAHQILLGDDLVMTLKGSACLLLQRVFY